ncbi:MAG: c-type cytochrome, partial [Acidimicrobiia bacterium]|nr:c-type cytochrome [Acidimicrobiia bacterium]
MSSIVIVVVALGALAWLAFLVATGLRGRTKDEVAPNLELFKTDDELETSRLDRVLAVSVILAGFLAISLPVYWLGEFNRQADFEVEFEEIAIERGELHVDEYLCAQCHGAGLAGGVAAYVDARSGISVSWAAPALNDIYYRYSRDEVKFWLQYGRANSPMPAWGELGNGPMNDAQLDEILDYLDHIQVPQSEAVANTATQIDLAVAALDTADALVLDTIAKQEALIAFYEAAPAFSAQVQPIADQARALLAEAEVGIDVDEDGVSDRVEVAVSALTAQAEATGFDGFVSFTRQFDPRNPDTVGAGDGDAASIGAAVVKIEQEALTLAVAAENLDRLLSQAQVGLEFVQNAAEERKYAFDVQAVADATFDGNAADATRAIGIYQANCARCHTSGYSEGPAFAQEA